MEKVKQYYKKARKWYSGLILEKQIFFALVATILIAGLVGSFF
jgi:hypothetical protein